MPGLFIKRSCFLFRCSIVSARLVLFGRSSIRRRLLKSNFASNSIKGENFFRTFFLRALLGTSPARRKSGSPALSAYPFVCVCVIESCKLINFIQSSSQSRRPYWPLGRSRSVRWHRAYGVHMRTASRLIGNRIQWRTIHTLSNGKLVRYSMSDRTVSKREPHGSAHLRQLPTSAVHLMVW